MLSTFIAMAMWMTQGVHVEGRRMPGAQPCPDSTRRKLLVAAKKGEDAFLLDCSFTLNQGETVARPLRIEGAAGSGIQINCKGGTITRGQTDRRAFLHTIAIWAKQKPDGEWSVPRNIKIENCHILGSIRLLGMGVNKSYELLAKASRRADFTAVAQRNAPSNVMVKNSRITADGSIAFYVGPGVHDVQLLYSRIDGHSPLAIYLDHESRSNAIRGNVIDLHGNREMIAIDGSANNRIVDNEIILRGEPAIRLYRNCGERGVIRHQTPSDNIIRDNVLTIVGQPPRALIVENARKGKGSVCKDDAGYPFGSSIDDMDHAERNRIDGNRVKARR